MNYTSTGLISQVKRRALIPSSQNLFTDSDLIDMLNEELQNRIIPYILNVREDYYLTYVEYDLSNLQTVSEVDIPTNAIGNKINQVSLFQSNPSVNNLNISINIPRLTNSQLDDIFSGYYLEGNKIKFNPSLNGYAGKLRIYYYKRPSEIVAITDCGLITVVNPNVSFTCSTLPATIVNGSNIDVIKSNQPWDTVQSLDSISLSVLTISDSDTTNVSVNDYVALRGKSPYAQIPQDTVPLLIQSVAVRLLEYMGDTQGLTNARETLMQMESDNRNIISARVDNQPKKIKARGISRYMPR